MSTESGGTLKLYNGRYVSYNKTLHFSLLDFSPFLLSDICPTMNLAKISGQVAEQDWGDKEQLRTARTDVDETISHPFLP